MSTTQATEQQSHSAPNGGRRLPPWMSMPGAPQRPDFAAFGSKMSELNGKRRKLIDDIKALQSSLQGTGGERSELDKERDELRQRLNEIDTLRRTQAQLRSGKNNEIATIRQQRREAADQLRELQEDLGGMKTVREIDEAIRYMMNKMETSGGGLGAERRTVKRMNQLEKAKSLLLELQPLAERIQEAEEREVHLQQEYREIHERIGVLNKEFEDYLKEKRNKDQEARATGSNRAEVYRQCDEIRVQIRELDEQMDTLREERDKQTEEWDTWCIDARAKYQAKQEDERKKRVQAAIDRKNAVRNAARMERAKRRQNPYQLEISACDTLLQHLVDLKRMASAEEEEEKRRAAAASFDPTKAAPPGTVVLSDSKWTNSKPLSKAARKQQQQQQKKKEATAAAAAESANTSAPSKRHDKVLQHPEDKMRLFEHVEQAPPVSLSAIDEAIASLTAKKKEYESHITQELNLSSTDSDEEEEEVEEAVAGEDTAAADEAPVEENVA